MKQFFWLALLVLPLLVSAQEQEGTAPLEMDEAGAGHALTLGLGLRGVNIGYAYQWNAHWGWRAEIGGVLIPETQSTINLSGQELMVRAEARIISSAVLIDWYPWATSSFRLFGGVGYAFDQELGGRGLYSQPVEYGELTFEGEEIGYVDVAIATRSIMPQLGFAFGRTLPKKRVSLSVEVGSFWWGPPSVDLQATRMLANTEREEDKNRERA